MKSDPGFWQIAVKASVTRRAGRVALIVGTALAVINHGDRLILGDLDLHMLLKILLSYCVPYSVSTYSSVLAIREGSNTEDFDEQ